MICGFIGCHRECHSLPAWFVHLIGHHRLGLIEALCWTARRAR